MCVCVCVNLLEKWETTATGEVRVTSTRPEVGAMGHGWTHTRRTRGRRQCDGTRATRAGHRRPQARRQASADADDDSREHAANRERGDADAGREQRERGDADAGREHAVHGAHTACAVLLQARRSHWPRAHLRVHFSHTASRVRVHGLVWACDAGQAVQLSHPARL